MTGVIVLVLALLAATAFGVHRRRTDGRLEAVLPAPAAAGVPAPAPPTGTPTSTDRRGTFATAATEASTTPNPGAPAAGGPASRLVPADLGTGLGERATLVQFSTAFCSPCRATRVTLGEVAAMLPGVAHVEIDAEAHLDLVRRLDVRRTPTVLVLDAQGLIRTRAAGAPRKADVIAALGEVL